MHEPFVTALETNGLGITDRNAAIAMTHTVCAGFDKNENTAVLAMRLVKDTDLSLKRSSYFRRVSVCLLPPVLRAHRQFAELAEAV
jgi:hypothetical protein